MTRSAATRSHDNGAWGVLIVPFPDTEPRRRSPTARAGRPTSSASPATTTTSATRSPATRSRTTAFFANPTNGDLGDISGQHTPGNCWHDNTDPAGVTSSPADLQATHGTCGVPNAGASLADPLYGAGHLRHRAARAVHDVQLPAHDAGRDAAAGAPAPDARSLRRPAEEPVVPGGGSPRRPRRARRRRLTGGRRRDR